MNMSNRSRSSPVPARASAAQRPSVSPGTFPSITLAARGRENLEETAAAVPAAGAEPLVIELDLSAVTAAKRRRRSDARRIGRIDALLNIAGAVPQVDLFEMTDEQWEAG